MDHNTALVDRIALLERELDQFRRLHIQEQRDREVKREVKMELHNLREQRWRRFRDAAVVLAGVGGLGVVMEALLRVLG